MVSTYRLVILTKCSGLSRRSSSVRTVFVTLSAFWPLSSRTWFPACKLETRTSRFGNHRRTLNVWMISSWILWVRVELRCTANGKTTHATTSTSRPREDCSTMAFPDDAEIAIGRRLRIQIRSRLSSLIRLAFERLILNYWKRSRNGHGVRSGLEPCS